MMMLSEHYDIAYRFAVYHTRLKNLHIVYISICVHSKYTWKYKCHTNNLTGKQKEASFPDLLTIILFKCQLSAK